MTDANKMVEAGNRLHRGKPFEFKRFDGSKGVACCIPLDVGDVMIDVRAIAAPCTIDETDRVAKLRFDVQTVAAKVLHGWNGKDDTPK